MRSENPAEELGQGGAGSDRRGAGGTGRVEGLHCLARASGRPEEDALGSTELLLCWLTVASRRSVGKLFQSPLLWPD